METRITAEEPIMSFLPHVSSPFMLGDELFMPNSVAPMAQPAYLMAEEGSVMTANQLETLRRQISVYATICQQLVEMHKASMSYRPALSGVMLPGQAMPFDSLVGAHKAPSRQRWAPSHSQLQILEKIFDQINGTPNKQKIKEITAELSQYGQITETNVYNWFQNRKARAKRKHQSATQKDGDSGGDTDGDSIDKKVRVDTSPDNCSGHNSGGSSGVHAYDQDQTSCFHSDSYVNSSSGLQGMASAHYKGGKNLGGKA